MYDEAWVCTCHECCVVYESYCQHSEGAWKKIKEGQKLSGVSSLALNELSGQPSDTAIKFVRRDWRHCPFPVVNH